MLTDIISWLAKLDPAKRGLYYAELSRKYPEFKPPADWQAEQPATKKIGRVHQHPPSPSPNIIRNGVRHVRPDTTPLVEQRGWKKAGNTWVGTFATRFGTWSGRIQHRGDTFKVEIRNPPTQMQNHPKWVCFSKRQRGWFNIHLHHRPTDHDVSAIIFYVERILTEALAKK